ncbi:MAG: substrate-binding domain-containing protein, partial [Cyanobacteria bacterium NC_groundwater_1444_Ag_S-0.65um_54_12]|nr:substrate-binding domain-containing protein [Cyanobacteria bacterium NC_groundwater_1444_Ag_S-0.65um_54_12]
IVTGVLGAQNLLERDNGFKRAINPQIRVLPQQADNGDKARAVEIAENVLIAHPEVRAFFTDNAIAGPGVGQALKSRRREGKVKLIAMDVTPDLLKLLKEGVADALIAQQPEKMGELAVETLVKAATGQKIPPIIDTGVTVVTRSEIAKSQH